MKIHSLNPDAMENHMELYLTLMFGKSGLSREERELIAVIVSIVNQCNYCVDHHAEALNQYWKDNEKIQKLINNFQSIDFSERKNKIIDYVSKLTKNPNELKKENINILKKSGFSDEEILNINLITCYFNFVNRIALGLGVESSDNEITGYKY
jgi:uncharacterized peroxidase-related enzyme